MHFGGEFGGEFLKIALIQIKRMSKRRYKAIYLNLDLDRVFLLGGYCSIQLSYGNVLNYKCIGINPCKHVFYTPMVSKMVSEDNLNS